MQHPGINKLKATRLVKGAGMGARYCRFCSGPAHLTRAEGDEMGDIITTTALLSFFSSHTLSSLLSLFLNNPKPKPSCTPPLSSSPPPVSPLVSNFEVWVGRGVEWGTLGPGCLRITLLAHSRGSKTAFHPRTSADHWNSSLTADVAADDNCNDKCKGYQTWMSSCAGYEPSGSGWSSECTSFCTDVSLPARREAPSPPLLPTLSSTSRGWLEAAVWSLERDAGDKIGRA